MATTTTPRYVVRKVGDQYIPMRQEERDTPSTILFGASGAMAGLWGLKHRGFLGLGALAMSACLVYRAATGRSLVERMTCGSCDSAKAGSEADTPSYHHQRRGGSDQAPADGVDEAVMESFPASDPPARSSSTGS